MTQVHRLTLALCMDFQVNISHGTEVFLSHSGQVVSKCFEVMIQRYQTGFVSARYQVQILTRLLVIQNYVFLDCCISFHVGLIPTKVIQKLVV